MKKILLLGTSSVQLDFAKVCKEMGLFVIGCSNRPIDRGKNSFDRFELIDITNKSALLQLAEDEQIDLIYSVGSDLALSSIAFVSEKMGLPSFFHSSIVDICTNKEKMRTFLGKTFFGNVPFQVLSNQSEKISLQFPLIIKPVDSQGQRGVFLVKNEQECEKRRLKSLLFSKTKRVIAEEFLEGSEVSVNVYMVDGTVAFAMISDRISWDGFHSGIIKKHIVPSSFSGNKTIMDLAKNTIARLQIINGPVYFQMKFKGNEPKLLEVTPRFDGCHLWRLIEQATGINLLKASLNQLLGNSMTLQVNKMKIQPHTLEFFCDVPESLMNTKKFNPPVNSYLEWYYLDEEKIRPINGQFEKVGYCIVKGID